MIEVKNYPKAFVEVEEILKYLPQEDFNKISSNFISGIRKNKDKSYSYKLDFTKNIEEQKILKETKTILAYIFLHYLGTEEENKIINQKFKEDIINNEQKKKSLYSTDVFKANKLNGNETNKNELVIYKNENLFEKFIKKLFKIDKD